MRNTLIAFGFALSSLLVSAAESSSPSNWQPLFNGTDFSGWHTWLGKPQPEWEVPGMKKGDDGKYLEPIGADRDPLKVFNIVREKDGPVLRFSGQGFGVMETEKSYSNFHLRAQFRWGEKRWAPRENVVRDSGVLYHVHGPSGVSGGVWPPSIECQIQEGDCGDLWTIHARAWATAKPKQGTQFAVYDPTQPVIEFASWESANSSRCIKSATHENPRGEWNTVEVICFGEESIHVINGHVVLRLKRMAAATGDQPLTSGRIALQTEGAEVYYRNVELRPISEIPAEYR